MDDLLREFLTETNESLDVVDVELVKFEQEPNNATILNNIFRLVHTIKGTCGFLGLPRLEAIAHAAETLMGKFRDGVPVTHEAVTLVLASIDRIKDILADLEAANGAEPDGTDRDLIDELERLSLSADNDDMTDEMAAAMAEEKAAEEEVGTDIYQVLERPLRPGEVSLDDLERAFQEAEVEIELPAVEEETEEDGEPVGAAAPNFSEAKTSQKEVAKPKNPSAKGKASSQGVSNQSIRVNVETLEHLMTMVSELVLTRNQLLEIVRRHEDSEFKVPLQRLSNVTGELQEGVMKTRMQPIGNAWQKLPRIVRDLSQELDKPIGLEMIGAETELDRQVLELIKDPLTHMIRNSADHGLEDPADRVAAGKPEKGNITLSAYHEGGHIIIEVKDDGRGLNLEKIKEKALKNGVTTEAELEKMVDHQIYKFIFAAGFSTATNVTSVSGRGVGMDVVRNNVELIGGSIDLRSTPGRGSSFIIKIPLTLAIVSTLIVEAGGDRYAIPQLSVVELVRVQSNSEHRIERLKDRPVLRLRSKLLPLVHMSELLGQTEEADLDEDNGFIVVMQVGSQSFGVVVDGVFHTEEIVVKPMSSMLRNINMFSGNTILGDGSVIMIIDPNGVASAMASHASGTLTDTAEDEYENAEAHVIDADAPISLLLFRAGSEEPKAVPLSLVTRLEEFDVNKIERSNGRDLVQYRGSLMPLVYVNEGDRHKSEGTQPMLVFSDNGRSMGLVVDQIVDIVEDRMTIEVVSERQGVLGSAIIRERATEVIDLGHYLPLAFDDWFMRKEIDMATKVRKLLFLDDSAFFRNMLTPVLKAAGYDVTVCSSAQSGYELMEKGTDFAAIVTDIEMPDISGYEFCESLRRDTRFRHMPIIALSAVVTPASIEKGRQAGFDDYVAKFDRPGLLAALKDVLTNEFGVAA
ncbi:MULTISPECIES: hybrid sensor histidine kinase/response regulator [unclassified Pseudovibrio]|uniref:hybrid sensor histidine kinase/response regulator n=1 Tax=unclassified Pseudovibrio TaxID=2627060 RepID=UPI0007AE9B7A|nr:MULTISPECIES: hybrid sensor histidine kinase/response regulator [unclassified Pseudovibrio]KZL03991.1 Chemotaxis protein CheA [Pseudovibrio sp. W74]KZL04210.1 Chemotaxis protein CheA [Pseudovibrio sp. Ad14]